MMRLRQVFGIADDHLITSLSPGMRPLQPYEWELAVDTPFISPISRSCYGNASGIAVLGYQSKLGGNASYRSCVLARRSTHEQRYGTSCWISADQVILLCFGDGQIDGTSVVAEGVGVIATAGGGEANPIRRVERCCKRVVVVRR